MHPTFWKSVSTTLALVSFARADYYIDDQNYTSISFSAGAKWGPFQEGGKTNSIVLADGTTMTVNASQCYNYTYTYATCIDDCQAQIPFTGSGITIYILQAGPQGVNASLAIDGGSPEHKVLPAPPGPSFYVPNVTLFNIQGIMTGNHTATLTVQNWDNTVSGMMLDYALINETIVSPTSSGRTSNSTPTASNKTRHIGAIVGGVGGGLAALLLVIFYLRRRRRHAPQRSSANLDDEPKIGPLFSADPLSNQPATAELYTEVPGRPATEPLMTSFVGAHRPRSARSGGSRKKSTWLGLTNPSAGGDLAANTTSKSPTHARGGSSTGIPGMSEAMSRPRIQEAHPMLSDDQVDFVHNLCANNVPPEVIARVIERMMAGERQPVVDGYGSLPPPSYYHHDVARDT